MTGGARQEPSAKSDRENSDPANRDGENSDLTVGIVELVREHHQAIYGYAYRFCGNSADAEDLAQQTFLIAQQKLAQLRDPGRAKGWLFTILRNGYLKNRSRRRPVPATNLELDIEAVPQTQTGLGDIDGEWLQHALDQLPDEFKLVLAMFYFEQCSYKEIAEQLEIPVGTVMSRLSRAKTHLRKRLTGSREPVAEPHLGKKSSRRPSSHVR